MLEAIVSALGLGIAGIDPLGAVILMAAITASFSRARIILFSVTVFLSAVIAGTILSLVGAGFILSIKDILPVATSFVWVPVNLVIATMIFVWIIRRKLTENKPKKVKASKKLNKSYFGVAATGILFGASSVFDPTFLAAISLAAQTNNLVTTVVMHTVWILTSQIMLFVLFVAYLYGKHEKVIAFARGQYAKHESLLKNILYVAAIVVAVILVSDTISYLIRGEYLINL